MRELVQCTFGLSGASDYTWPGAHINTCNNPICVWYILCPRAPSTLHRTPPRRGQHIYIHRLDHFSWGEWVFGIRKRQYPLLIPYVPTYRFYSYYWRCKYTWKTCLTASSCSTHAMANHSILAISSPRHMMPPRYAEQKHRHTNMCYEDSKMCHLRQNKYRYLSLSRPPLRCEQHSSLPWKPFEQASNARVGVLDHAPSFHTKVEDATTSRRRTIIQTTGDRKTLERGISS